ncbi:MAG: hypothetical protein IPP48_03585 [Chitinophagaceae bacterium]|nr:hypothetical protein [Chitinophagaceae bacterium]
MPLVRRQGGGEAKNTNNGRSPSAPKGELDYEEDYVFFFYEPIFCNSFELHWRRTLVQYFFTGLLSQYRWVQI